jgi:DNA-directed RNA polymerase subunit RPC12/RpoP
MSNYNKSSCNHCGAKNWIYTGDPEDYTSCAGESPVAKCWKCNKKFLWNYWFADGTNASDIRCMYPDWDTEKSVEENVEALEDYVEGSENG